LSAARRDGRAFSIVGTEVMASTGYLEIEQLEVEVPDGTRHGRSVVRHPGAVGVVAVEATGTRAIMVRQYRASIDRDLLEVPAGKRDVPGEPPEVTAVRELDEEVGYRPRGLVKLAEFFNSPGFCDELSHIYVALDIEPTDGPSPVGPEESAMTLEWIELADVEALIASGALVDAKSIIGLLLARRHLAGEYPGLS
jgi:8-oxo-dGTP pyrophosphatase MutT (NUDIX family)